MSQFPWLNFVGFFLTLCEAVRSDQVSEKPVNSDEAQAELLAGVTPASVEKQNFLST